MNNPASRQKKNGKLIVFWLLSLLCIPMLSFYGRGFQLNVIGITNGKMPRSTIFYLLCKLILITDNRNIAP